MLPDPLRTQPWTDRAAEVAAAAEREPVIDAVLRPGDALYLPRGYLHSATALGEISAHLTIGVHSVTRWAAAESALDLVRTLAAEDPELRGSLPLGVDLADPDAVRDDVAAVIAGLQDWLGRVDPAEVADRLRAQHLGAGAPRAGRPAGPVGGRGRAHRRHRAAAAPAAALLAPRRRRRPGHPARRPALALLPRRGPRRRCAALLAAGELKVGDLPGLDPADRLTLARRLVTESIAVVPDAGPRAAAHDGPCRSRERPDRRDRPGRGVGTGPPARPAGRQPLLGAGAGPRRLPRRHRLARPSAGC